MEKGDIVQLEYEGWIVGTNELFDTTNEELARKEKSFDEEKSYGPINVIVGAGRVIQGLDDELLKAEVDKEYEVEIPPEKAYGVRDPKNVETHSFRELARLKVEPELGKSVVIRNRQGWIAGIFAGRVRIDFNHKLASRTLKYKYKVVSKAETPEARVRAIIAMAYGREGEFQVELDGDETLSLTLPDVCKYDPNWTLSKLRLVGDLREHAGLKTVVMREVYVKKEAAPEGEAGAEGEATTEAHAHEHDHGDGLIHTHEHDHDHGPDHDHDHGPDHEHEHEPEHEPEHEHKHDQELEHVDEPAPKEPEGPSDE
jgi:FKBP-type peptidyl-prolyl cis-trans isomerase 2